MSISGDVQIRRALASESDEVASVLIASRRAAVPAIPPLVHSDAEVRAWFSGVVMATNDVWVAHASTIIGVIVLSEGWIEHLYVAPHRTNRGVGSALLAHAKSEAAGSLDLWTFASNIGARRFYQRHGFVEIDRSDGANEEGEPDIKYRWSGS